MTPALWAICYELDVADQAEYERWFHEVHMPEKLSRPGYLWAAHYALEGDNGFLALFGGASSRTFLNPSPAQLAARQSAETRRFIGMRRRPNAWILVEEARVEGPEAHRRDERGTPGPVIQFGVYTPASAAVEDDLGAWYAQERLPALEKLPGCLGARKLLVTVGAQKHAILHEFVSLDAREQHFAPLEAQAQDPNTWFGRIRPQLAHAPRSPVIGRRISPEPG